MSLFNADTLSSAPVRTLLDPGRYHVRINGAKEVVSNQKNTPGVELSLEVVIGQIQENKTDPAGRKLFTTIWKSQDETKQGMFYGQLHKIADAVGFDLAAFAGMDADEFTLLFLEALLQKELGVKVIIETYNNKEKEVVSDFFAL